MPFGNYVYTSDAGTDYSVSVPSDVADAIGMPSATTEPYIDAIIGPRYAVARSASGLYISAVVHTQATMAALIGTTTTVGGVDFRWQTYHGEKRIPFNPTSLQAPMGPMGPAGPTGATGATGPTGPTGPSGGGGGGGFVQEWLLGSDVTLSGSGNMDTIFSVTAVTGLMLCLATVYFGQPSGVEQFRVHINAAGGNIAEALWCSTSTAEWVSVTCVGLMDCSGANGIQVQASSYIAGSKVLANSGLPGAPTNMATRLLVTQVG